MAAHARIQSGTNPHDTEGMEKLTRDWRTLCHSIGGYDHYQYDSNRRLDVTDCERRLLAQFVD